LSSEVKAAAFADADVFVLASYSENFGVAPVEAMSFGIPVVVSKGVGICDDISEAGAGEVVRCEVGDIAGALLRLLSSPLLRAEIGARGISLARKRFSKQAVSQQVVGLYEAILSRSETANGAPPC